MKLIQLSDLHLMADPAAELKGIRTRHCLEHVLQSIASEHADAQQLIITGDLAHDEQRTTYEAIAELFRPWWSQLRLIPGNHDERSLMRDVFGDRIQAVDDRNVFLDRPGGWTLIGLDSHVPGELRGELGVRQLDWLEQRLHETPSQPVCMFVHHPPIEVHSEWLDKIRMSDGDKLTDLILRNSNVRCLACGHVHQERTTVVPSCTVLTTPSTGVQFKPETQQLEVHSLPPGYRVFRLGDHGELATWIERVELPGHTQ